MWQTILSPLRGSATGSRIIITTRDEVVASTLGSKQSYRLDFLQPEDCWSIFSMCASQNSDIIQTHPDTGLIRAKVIKRSKGLPLAATVLGGLLCSEHVDHWLKILNHKLWDLSELGEDQIPTALKLSYYHLPCHLKRCFAYCSLFPKDHLFKKEEL